MPLQRLVRSYGWTWLTALALLGLGGCAHKPGIGPLPLRYAPPFSASGQAHVPDRWWTAFDDPALNQEIDRSLGGSFNLAAAFERISAADALTRREASDLWPDVNGFGEAEGIFLTDAPNDALYALGVDAAYQVDLWGQIRARVDAQRLRTTATLADYQAVALTLSADIAATWYSLIEARAQVELLNEQIESNLTGLEQLEEGFRVGQSRSADVLRQRQLVESTREQLVVAQSRIEVLEHQLAVLQGQPPQEASYDTGAVLPDLPPLPDTGLPAELVIRRPDVLRDYLALQAADRDLAAAVTDQYPRLNLTASVTTIAESPENLFREWIGSVAGQLIGPILDGGQRRAEVDRTAAVARQRLNEYGETVLQAFREVEDALARERYQRERIEHLNAQLDLAQQASEQLLNAFFLDREATDFFDVLNTTTEQQRLQRATLSARLELILNRISLYLALAGGFESRPPAPGGIGPPEYFSDE